MIFYPYRGFEAASVPCFMFSLTHVFVRNAGDYAFWIDPPVTATTVILQNCYANINKGGFRLEKISELSVLSCAADTVTGAYGFYFESCRGSATGLHVEKGTITGASIAVAGGDMQIVAPKFSSNTLTDGGYEINVNSGAKVALFGGYNYATVCSGAGTYSTIYASASAAQFVVYGGGYVIPTGDGTKTIYLGNIRRYDNNSTIEPIIVFGTTDATPSVSAGRIFKTADTTGLTDFDDGETGQVITVIAGHTVVITDGTNIFLSGSANWTMTLSDTLTLICQSDNKWYELSRSDSGA